MTNSKDNFDKFKEWVEKWQMPTSIARGLASGTPIEKTSARENAAQYVSRATGRTINPDVPDHILNNALVAESVRYKEDATKYFSGHYKQVISGIENSKLEEKSMTIMPYKIEGNESHNQIADFHEHYLSLEHLLNKFEKTGSLPESQERMLKEKVASKKSDKKREELKEKGYSEDVQSLGANAERYLLYGLSDEKELIKEGELILKSYETEMDKIFTKNNMSKALYAQRNLLQGITEIMGTDDPEKVFASMGMVYGVAENKRLDRVDAAA